MFPIVNPPSIVTVNLFTANLKTIICSIKKATNIRYCDQDSALFNMFHLPSTLQSSSHLLAIYSEPGEEAQRDPEGPENQHASFSPIPPKTAFCQVVLWTECVFFKFIR